MQRSFSGRYEFRLERVVENERRVLGGAFSSNLLPTDPYHFSDTTGKVKKTRQSVETESNVPLCLWKSSWQIEDFDDSAGWRYAFDFGREKSLVQGQLDHVRHRSWVQVQQWELPVPSVYSIDKTYTFRSMRSHRRLGDQPKPHTHGLHRQDAVIKVHAKPSTILHVNDIDVSDARTRSREDVPVLPADSEQWLDLLSIYSACFSALFNDTQDRTAR